jgi:formylglycine-generating enzyme required for sulfatase activity
MPGASRDSVPTHVYLIVDQMPDDVSPFGVIGMAGNVSEWTDTIAPGSIQGEKVAIICGANFKTNSETHAVLTYRNKKAPGVSDFWIGFRCVSDTAPAK